MLETVGLFPPVTTIASASALPYPNVVSFPADPKSTAEEYNTLRTCAGVSVDMPPRFEQQLAAICGADALVP